MPRLVVLDGHTVNPGDTSWAAFEALGELIVHPRTQPSEIVPRARGADVVITNKTPLDAETLGRLDGLRGICVLATGFNVVDGGHARSLGIPVCNVPRYGTASVVEHTFALLLELARQVGQHDAAVHAGEWVGSPDFAFWKTPQLELSGRTLGVVGYGEIGSAVARVALAFGLRVLATPSRSRPAESGVGSAELAAVFRQADVLSLHCPLTADTRELVRWERLVSMKPSALLVNTARGGLVCEPDLARALREGVIAGAALDVLAEEPPRPDNPLLTAPRCLLTPHLAWTSLAARERLIAVSAGNARAILEGRPANVVNPSA